MTRRLSTGFGRAAIGILVSLACIYLVLRGVDLGKTADILGGARPAWLVLALAGVAADLFFRALRWQCLIAPIKPVPLRRLSAYMLVGYLANNVLPARLGELVRSHYLGDREGISRSATLGTVVVERIVDTVVLVGIGAAAILVLNIRGVVASAVLVGVALAGVLVVALAIALAAHRLPGAERAAAFLNRWPRFVGVATRLRDGLRVAALPRTVAGRRPVERGGVELHRPGRAGGRAVARNTADPGRGRAAGGRHQPRHGGPIRSRLPGHVRICRPEHRRRLRADELGGTRAGRADPRPDAGGQLDRRGDCPHPTGLVAPGGRLGDRGRGSHVTSGPVGVMVLSR